MRDEKRTNVRWFCERCKKWHIGYPPLNCDYKPKEDIKPKDKVIVKPHGEKPSVTEVEIECGLCQSEGTIYFTNVEIFGDTMIQQHCKKCDMFTVWMMKMNEHRKEIPITEIDDLIRDIDHEILKDEDFVERAY